MPTFARLLLLCLICAALPARGGVLALVLSDSSRPYLEFKDALTDALGNGAWQLKSYPLEALNQQSIQGDVVVAVGSEALRRILTYGHRSPLLATLVTRQHLEKLQTTSPGKRFSGIYLDQPPGRQLAFVRALLPGHRRVGLLISQETISLLPRFRQEASPLKLQLESEAADEESQLLPALNTLLPKVDVLLANPDNQVFKRGNIKAILMTSFRHQKPLIGYSEAFTQAGAIASLYSTPAQIAQQAALMITRAPSDHWPAWQAPSFFTFNLNPTVAQSLGLTLPDEFTLRETLKATGDAQ